MLEVAKALRFHTPLSLLMIDIDFFKQINDRFGHLVGDEILVSVASLIKQHSRRYDLVVRFGGEEFVLLLPSTTHDQAKLVAEKIRKQMESYHFVFNNHPYIQLTVSIGIASLPLPPAMTHQEPGVVLDLLIEKADKTLYLAKSKGRNCFEG
jgi:diguanylate cyclase (GGDEF)-like protein